MQFGQPFVLNFLGWKFFPFLFITNKALCFFLCLGKFLHTCGCSVPFFKALSTVSSLWVQLSCSSIIGFSHKPTVLDFCLDLFLSYFFKHCSWTLFAASLTLLYSIFWLWISFFGLSLVFMTNLGIPFCRYQRLSRQLGLIFDFISSE